MLITLIFEKLSYDVRLAGMVLLIASIVGFLISLSIWVVVCHDEGKAPLLFYLYITVGMIPFIMWVFTVSSKIYNHLKTWRSEKRIKTEQSEKDLKIVGVKKTSNNK